MQYAIYEENMERLVSRLTTIKNKCIKNGVDFHFEILGEEFREVELENGDKITTKYLLVEADGTVKHNDWQFIATIQHKDEGNVIRQFVTDIEVPEKYYSTDSICEHCNTRRSRKDTYLIHNEVTGEWKQVGKTCLKEFTQGLDADEVARYISLFDNLIEGETPYGNSSFEQYYLIEDILKYAFETVKHFGYQPSRDYIDRPTRMRCMEYYKYDRGSILCSDKFRATLRQEMSSVNFNADSNKIAELVKDAIRWAVDNEDSNSYMHNLKVICSSKYCTARDLGILVSLAPTYNRHLEQEAKRIKSESDRQSEVTKSNFVGNEGDRITFITEYVRCVYTREDVFGCTYMYKFVDCDGNVYMWSTGKCIEDDVKLKVTGTVKSHETFRDVKQTWVTRCKVEEI